MNTSMGINYEAYNRISGWAGIVTLKAFICRVVHYLHTYNGAKITYEQTIIRNE